jgi:type IX secretion system PorP/SprF family membrane protein
LFFTSKKRIFKQADLIKKTVIYLFFNALLLQFSFGQDIHFSQFNGSILNVSPGFTGLFNGDFRVGAIYRSQWQTVPVKYSTFSMTGEARIKPQQLAKDMVGVGVVFNSDRAGDARYGTTQFYVNGSYIFLGRPDSSLLISLGMNLGFCQVGFDYSKMTFNNQYDGLQFVPSSASGEEFSYTNINFVDINLGASAQYILYGRHRFTYGMGLFHLTNPKITYQENKNSRLDFKLTNYIGYATPVGVKTDIIGEMLLTNQGKNYELIPHASLKYYISRDLNQAVLGGLCFRARDAVVLRFGYHYKTLQSGIAYDVNVSKFTAATNRRGGFEMYVNYIIKQKRSYIAKKRFCPVFM